MQCPPVDHAFFPQDVLNRNIERDLNELIGAPRLEFPQKLPVVLDVRKDIDRHHEIEVLSLPRLTIPNRKVQFIVGPRLAQFNGLRRDVGPPQFAAFPQPLLNDAQNLTCATAGIEDCRWDYVIAVQYFHNLFRFPL